MGRVAGTGRKARARSALALGLALAAWGCSGPTATTTSEAPVAEEGPCVLEADTRVGDLTLTELRRFELNNGEPIPTLGEFLDLANDAGVGVLPEIKTFPPPEGGEAAPATPGQLEEFATLVEERTSIPEVLIGSFDESTLAYFAENHPTWTRVWFRGLGRPGDPAGPPTVEEMRTRAPSGEVLGVLNILYEQGTSPLTGEDHDVPLAFATAGIPVYIWFNVLTGGDSATDGEGTLGYDASPGWESLVALEPRNIVWMATDVTGAYAEWAASLPPGLQPAPAMVAHRGGGTEGEGENSLSAFRQAVADGASVLETDVQWTRPTDDAPNGVPVLMHDATINRTVRCPG